MPFKTSTRDFGSNHLKISRILRLFLSFLIGLLCVLGSPVLALLPHPTLSSTITSPLQQGKMLYDGGRFAEAVKVLQQAAQEYRQQKDELKLATTLSNLSLAYQQLGAWAEAQQAIDESLKLLKSNQKEPVFAQSLLIKGRLQLAMGKPEAALTTWQQAAAIYQQAKNPSGVVRSQINQAQAWRTQGFYRRAVQMLEAVQQQLQSQPDSLEKAVGLRSLGDALLISGNLRQSQNVLQQSRQIAENLKSPAEMAASVLSLANNARKQQQTQQAIAYYQQAIQLSPSPLAKVQAQLNYLSLLVEVKQLAQVQNLLPAIQSQLNQLPVSRAAIYAQINFAQSLIQIGINSQSSITNPQIAQLLANAVNQSRKLGDQRAEAYALLSLGHLYEQTKQWSDAQRLTQKGLTLGQASNTPDLAYRLQWQLGRLLWQQKQLPGAIAAYDAAVDTLKYLRSDLAAINQDVQFNFRDSVEPVYRESVQLLLQSQTNDKILDKVRQRIEALQLAELDNFFQEACLQGQSVALDQIVDQENPNTAVFYPIILPQQLQVIVKLPHQKLQNYSTNIAQGEVEKVVANLRTALVSPSATKAIRTQSQTIYNWLLKPIESQLSASKVDTLVFVLDGVLRNIPMASLYDGEKYLIEKYAIALSVSLQLQNPQPLVKQQLKGLIAGLSEPPLGFSNFAPLPAIKSEVNYIAQAGVSTTNLLDQQFTRQALEAEVNTVPFNVLHLATHGQFSSNADQTFILAADGPIHVKQFDSLLRSRDAKQQQAVELLVLSACQTAMGDNRAALGLAGTAIRAGARSTLASLWQIDDESTALFVGDFYQQLKKGNISKAQALRHAQLAMLKHPNFKAPSFWAAYVLIGNWL
ncbi:CHAT domain-containing protein [Nostoc sp. FACHB-152]|uniref:CHAT domain-containing protein n=1 Tax=unclassified Nostoc TaxID=2593658 RepID=UPI001681E153|nr:MULTISPECIES: CHAT domain-containing protein [unclassified Nostoc]MBD2447176.1 CHAT domain-containing protein [Nostoc sp. FACHB-152]MBD2469146.1 CHAT domain-containing protein [Nostoc sp. FACHB-145]